MQKHLTISIELDKKFRAVIAKRKVLKKGCIRECTEEAINDWISKNKEDELIGYI